MSKERHSAVKLSLVKISNCRNTSSQSNFVPPVLQEVGKLAAGVASVATAGSATGNPRNKHALQPGHSLMDWIRLGSSGKDLTDVGPRAGQLSITPRQLAQHDKEQDAWIAIRGKVYNVTQYIPFHPGGPEELMRGIGKDATSLFDQVHAWVNYEKLLQKCYLGRLVTVDPNINTEELFLGKSKFLSPKLLPPNKVGPLDDYEVVSEKDTTSVILVQETVSINSNSKEINESVNAPRFDWIQKTDFITLIFYTKSFCNPKIEVKKTNVDNVLTICLEYGQQVFVNDFKLLKAIQLPGLMKINYETGKIEVQFKKVESKIWESYGALRQRNEFVSLSSTECKYNYRIISKIQINYNTSLLELQRVEETQITVPIGRHVEVFINIQGHEISRSYTPVPSSLLTQFKPQTIVSHNICLMVKSYPNGGVSKYICGKKQGDVLELSKPIGSFNLATLESRETFLLLAAGTGITPILGVLLFLLERRIRKCQSVTLLFFNKTEADILIRDQLEVLQNEDKRFTVEYILSQSDRKWKGRTGQVSPTILQEIVNKQLLNTVYTQRDIFSLICGPTQFSNLSRSLLLDLGFQRDQIHVFLG